MTDSTFVSSLRALADLLDGLDVPPGDFAVTLFDARSGVHGSAVRLQGDLAPMTYLAGVAGATAETCWHDKRHSFVTYRAALQPGGEELSVVAVAPESRRRWRARHEAPQDDA